MWAINPLPIIRWKVILPQVSLEWDYISNSYCKYKTKQILMPSKQMFNHKLFYESLINIHHNNITFAEKNFYNHLEEINPQINKANLYKW